MKLERFIGLSLAAAALVPAAPAAAGDMSTCTWDAFDYPDPTGGEWIVLNPVFIREAWNGEEVLDPPTASLESGAGDTVELVFTDIVSAGPCSFFVARPAVELEPGTEYTLHGAGPIAPVFLTGEEVDEEPPQFELEPRAGDGCVFDVTAEEELVLITYKVPITLGHHWYAIDAEGIESIDLGGCASSPGGESVEFTAYDRAGHTATRVVELPAADDDGGDGGGAGCAAAPIAGSAAPGLLALLFG